MHPQLTGYRYSIAYPSSARHGPGQARLNGQGFFESSGVINDHLLCESADADIHTEVLQKAVRKQLNTLVTASLILQLRFELAADGFMDELPIPASTSASFLDLLHKRRTTCSGELCIRTNLPPYHWPGTVTLRLISGLFAKSPQELSAAQCLFLPPALNASPHVYAHPAKITLPSSSAPPQHCVNNRRAPTTLTRVDIYPTMSRYSLYSGSATANLS
ncbi:hypothetical protein V8E52_009181 [Russula decolorans]